MRPLLSERTYLAVSAVGAVTVQNQRKHKTVDYCESSNLHKQFHFSDVAQSSPHIDHADLTSSRNTRGDISRDASSLQGSTMHICPTSQQHASNRSTISRFPKQPWPLNQSH